MSPTFFFFLLTSIGTPEKAYALPSRPVALSFDSHGLIPIEVERPQEPHWQAGIVLVDRNAWADAYREFDAAVAAYPEDLGFRAARARAAMRSGRKTALVRKLSLALYDPYGRRPGKPVPIGFPESWYELALLHQDDRPEEAAKCVANSFAQAWEVNGRPNRLRTSKGWPSRYLEFEIKYRQFSGDIETRCNLLQKNFLIAPNVARVRDHLAGALADGTISSFWRRENETKIREEPGIPRKPELARQVYAPVFAANPNHPLALYTQGYIEEVSGQSRAAIRCYKKYLRLSDPFYKSVERRADVVKRVKRITEELRRKGIVLP